MDSESYDKLEPIAVNFSESWVPPKAKKLKPKAYKDGSGYCCIFGPDPVVGIFGCGSTLQEAFIDWEKDLQKRLEKLTEGDEAGLLAHKHLGQQSDGN